MTCALGRHSFWPCSRFVILFINVPTLFGVTPGFPNLAVISCVVAASDETIRPVLDIIKEVKEQGNGTKVKYNNLKVRRLLEEAAENFMLGLATVDKSVLEWLADDCTMIDPSLDKKSYSDYVVHGKSNIVVVQGEIFSFWEGLIRDSTTKGANKAKEASKTTEALWAEENMKGDFHVGKFGAAFVICLDKNVMIKRVEFRDSEIVKALNGKWSLLCTDRQAFSRTTSWCFGIATSSTTSSSCMSGKLALPYPTHWEREGASKGLSTSLAIISLIFCRPTQNNTTSIYALRSRFFAIIPQPRRVFTMNGSPEIDPVQEAIHFWCNDENVDWLEEILHTHLQPLIDNINAGGLHSSWEWFTDDATLTTSINLPRCEGTTFEGRDAINDYFASQYNAEPRMKFVPLLCTYGQGHMACHAWYGLDDEHGLSSPRDYQLLITADFNDYHRLVSMEISEYTVAGPASYIETVDNCVACRAMASMRRERQMEEDADDSIDDEAYSDWPYRNDDHDH
ncbi:hypothetical protein CSPX01_10426 [Colletotrichum filicis]|nr:hypothetical protein CSPX01_10426 [Colletotrichum filicis]